MGGTGLRAGALVLGVAVLAGCSSAATGQGSGGTSAPASSSASSSPDFPSGSASAAPTASAPTSSAPPSVASSTPTYQVVTVRGLSSGKSISVRVYAQDKIADCAAHAYGATMIRFLGAHPCNGAKRVLGTTVVDGRTAVLSVIGTGFTGTPKNQYGVAGQFQKLEKADGTGSINDLLREGHTIPGIASRIPDHEVFQVLGQDQGVAIFDAWYQNGSTGDHDARLKNLEMELFLTPLSTG